MAIKHNGLHFIPRGDGGVTIQVSQNATENAELIREVPLSAEQWTEITASIIPPEALPSAPDLTPGIISTVVSDEAIELIKEATTEKELDQLQADEEASQKHPGGRKGVLDAIMKRRDELDQE